MAGVAQASKQAITLKGSTETVADFFHYGLNSILYQRGIYSAETFKKLQKYDLTLFETTDDRVKSYLEGIMTQVREWLEKMTVQKLVLVVKSVYTKEVLERWQFVIKCDKDALDSSGEPKPAKAKTAAQVKKEISAVLRQITATVTFLPLLEESCVFDVLVYTDRDSEVPEDWAESHAHHIANSDQVQLKSFSTSVHRVDTAVVYKRDTELEGSPL